MTPADYRLTASSTSSAIQLRLPRLLDELVLARADGRLPRLMAAWARIDLLVLDDLGLQPVSPPRAADLLEVIEDRAGLRSTIVTSQLPIGHWHEALGEPTIADAILDRLVHGAYRLELKGGSMRRAQATDGSGAVDGDPSAPTGAKTTASDGPGRPKRGRADIGHPSPAPASDRSAAMPDYPESNERR